AERGFVAMRGENKKEIHPIAQRGLVRSPGTSLTPVSQTFVYAAILQHVAGRYPQHPDDLQTKAGYASTALVAPITFHGEIIGVLYLDRPKAKQPFSAGAGQHLLAAGAQLGALMADASRRLVEGAAREGAAWLATARRLQKSLTAELAKGEVFDAALKLLPGRTRCGDFVDVLHLGAERCVAIVTDAGGQGIAGLVQAAAMRASLRTALRLQGDELNLPSAFQMVNEWVARQAARRMVTLTVVSLDLTSARITYINAAGPSPILMAGPGRLITLDQPSLMPGVDPEYGYEATTVDLPSPFLLVCHSDGLTEGANAAGEPFGDKRLHELLLERASFAKPVETVEKVAAAFNTHVAGHAHDDDAMIFVLGK
ncbi:MAG TPA: SpoIIE family protein phosphatase, partial [Phycisphaerae bacterium]